MNQTILTYDAYLALLVVLVNFVLATLIMVRTSRTILYIIFFFVCISNMVWNFGDFMTFFTGNQLWFYLSLMGSGMLPALMFHFINTLVYPERKSTFWILPAYLFSGFLSFSGPLAIIHPGVQRFVDSELWNILYLILLGPFILVGMIILCRAIRRARSEDERSRLGYILVVMIIGVLTGLSDLVQILRIPVPPLGHAGCLAYSSILAIGVFKHRSTYDVLAQMRVRLQDLSEMAAGIAHEIGNPLTSIKGAADLLGKKLKTLDHPECREYHAVITEEIERINNILNNYRYFTKPLKAEVDTISMNQVIQKTVKLVDVGILPLQLKLDLCSTLPMVQADASLMKQVFLNLIKNAAEACGSKGEVVIKTEAIPSFVKISFTDDGPGIPPELKNRVFEPFFTTKSAGIGVGLSISQRIVQAHRGRIEVNSRSPRGTEFSIFLPVSR